MIRFAPILLAVLAGLGMYWFSSRRMRRQLDQQSVPLNDPAIMALTRRLARVLDVPKVPVFVYQVDVVNGLAAPDGRVFITEGFLNKYRLGEVSAEEITSVIAHELGHVAMGHARKRLIDFSGQNAVRTVLAMVLGRFIPFVGIYIANALTQALAAGMSRADEFEADELPNTVAIMCKFTVQIGATQSTMELAIPESVIKGAADDLENDGVLSSDTSNDEFMHASIDASVKLKPLPTTLKKVRSLKVGDRLPLGNNGPLEGQFLVNGQEVFNCAIGRSGETYSLKISDQNNAVKNKSYSQLLVG